MTEDALYKKSDLSINDLSSKLGVHPNYLSQIINQKEKKNFYDFVNTYRIEEFKRLIALQKNQQFTLLSLAYDCGFSSKSSFNRYFQKSNRPDPLRILHLAYRKSDSVLPRASLQGGTSKSVSAFKLKRLPAWAAYICTRCSINPNNHISGANMKNLFVVFVAAALAAVTFSGCDISSRTIPACWFRSRWTRTLHCRLFW